MANTQVTLIWRCKTDKGWRRFRALYGKNGRVRRGYVLVDGEEQQYPEGIFELRFYQDNKMQHKPVGEDSTEALNAKRRQENLMLTRTTAAAAGVKLVEFPNRKTLAQEFAKFKQAALDRGSPEAEQVYRIAVEEFLSVVGKTYVDELNADDMLRYQRALRARGCSDRTIFNRYANTKAFYLYCGLDPKKIKLVPPKYEEQTPEVYEPEELDAFFLSIKKDESLYAACQLMYQCGLWDQEARYLEWRNVNLRRGVLHIEGNPRYGFKVKDLEQRDVPIPPDLCAWLEAYRKRHPGHVLVAGTKKGKPTTKFLRMVKRAARRAKLNCNQCEGCARLGECSHWFLHKFRATYITTLLRGGMDLRTVMKMSGHANLETVMRYLSPAGDDAVRARVSAIRWAR